MQNNPDSQLALDPQVPLQVLGVLVGVGVIVGVSVGVLVGVAVGVAVGVGVSPNVKAREVHAVGTSWALGFDVGAVGATASCLNWYNLTAVNTATPAKISVANIIPIVATLFFIYLD